MRAALFSLLLISAPALAEKEKLLVADLAVGSSDLRDAAGSLVEQLMTELSRSSQYDVIGSSDVTLILGLERQRQLLGCADQSASCLAEIGGALGARLMVSGALTRAGEVYRIDLKLIDTLQAKVLARVGRTVESREELIRLTGPLVDELLATGAVARPSGPGIGKLLPWVTMGAGVVSAAIGLGLVVGAGAEAARLNMMKQSLFWAALESQGAAVQRTHWAGVALLGLGGALVGGGVLWAWLGREQPPPVQAQVLVGPEGAAVMLGGAL